MTLTAILTKQSDAETFTCPECYVAFYVPSNEFQVFQQCGFSMVSIRCPKCSTKVLIDATTKRVRGKESG
jgi:RNase P subunit RPR2